MLGGAAPSLPDKPSIAVLPFSNIAAIPTRNISPTGQHRQAETWFRRAIAHR